MLQGRYTATFLLSVFLSLAFFTLAHAQTPAAGASGPNNANKECPAEVRTGASRKYYDKSRAPGETWNGVDLGTRTQYVASNLYGKSCPTTVPGVNTPVQGKCQAEDDCKYAGDIKKPDVPTGDTTGAGGTQNQTGANTPWKPLQQPTAEEVNNAFQNGAKPVDFISNNPANIDSGQAFNNFLGGNSAPDAFSGSIFEQAAQDFFNPGSSFNSDYLNMSNTSGSFPEPGAGPQGLDSLNANNGYNPSAPYSAPATPDTTGFTAPQQNAPAGEFGAGAQPVQFAPSVSDPWAIQTQAPVTPTSPFAPEPSIGNQLAEAGNSFDNGAFTAPANTNWTGANEAVPFADYKNTGGQFVAEKGVGNEEPLAQFATPSSPLEVKTPADLAGVPLTFQPSKEIPVVAVAALNDGAWAGTKFESANGELDYNVARLTGEWTGIAHPTLISTQEGGFAYAENPAVTAELEQQSAANLANQSRTPEAPPQSTESVNPGEAPPTKASGFAENVALNNPNIASDAAPISSGDVPGKELPKDSVEALKEASTGQSPADKSGTNNADAVTMRATCYGTVECGDNPRSSDSTKDNRGGSLDPRTEKIIAVGSDSQYKNGDTLRVCNGNTCGDFEVRDTCGACKGTNRIDLTYAAAKDIGMDLNKGNIPVTVSRAEAGTYDPFTSARAPGSYVDTALQNGGLLSPLQTIETGALPDITPNYNALIPTPEWNPMSGEQVTADIQNTVNQEGQAAQLADRIEQAKAEMNAFNNPPIPLAPYEQVSGESLTKDIYNQAVADAGNKVPVPDTSYQPDQLTQKQAWADLLNNHGQAIEVPTSLPANPVGEVTSEALPPATPEPVSQEKLAELVAYAKENSATTPDLVPQGTQISPEEAQKIANQTNPAQEHVDTGAAAKTTAPDTLVAKAQQAAGTSGDVRDYVATVWDAKVVNLRVAEQQAKAYFDSLAPGATITTDGIVTDQYGQAKDLYEGAVQARVDAEKALVALKTDGTMNADMQTLATQKQEGQGWVSKGFQQYVDGFKAVGEWASTKSDGTGVLASLKNAVIVDNPPLQALISAPSTMAGGFFKDLQNVSELTGSNPSEQDAVRCASLANGCTGEYIQSAGNLAFLGYAGVEVGLLKDTGTVLSREVRGAGETLGLGGTSDSATVVAQKIETSGLGVDEALNVEGSAGAHQPVQGGSSGSGQTVIAPGGTTPGTGALDTSAAPQSSPSASLREALTEGPPNVKTSTQTQVPELLKTGTNDGGVSAQQWKQIANEENVAGKVASEAPKEPPEASSPAKPATEPAPKPEPAVTQDNVSGGPKPNTADSVSPPTEVKPATQGIKSAAEFCAENPAACPNIEVRPITNASPPAPDLPATSIPKPGDWARSPRVLDGVEPIPITNDIAPQWNAIDELIAQRTASQLPDVARVQPAFETSVPTTRVAEPITYPQYNPTQNVPARLAQTPPAGNVTTNVPTGAVSPTETLATQEQKIQALLDQAANKSSTQLDKTIADLRATAADKTGAVDVAPTANPAANLNIRPTLSTQPESTAPATGFWQNTYDNTLGKFFGKTDTFPAASEVKPAIQEGTLPAEGTTPVAKDFNALGETQGLGTLNDAVAGAHVAPPPATVPKPIEVTVPENGLSARVSLGDVPADGVRVQLNDPNNLLRFNATEAEKAAVRGVSDSTGRSAEFIVTQADLEKIQSAQKGALADVTLYPAPQPAFAVATDVGAAAPIEDIFLPRSSWTLPSFNQNVTAGLTVGGGLLGTWALGSSPVSQDLSPGGATVQAPGTNSGASSVDEKGFEQAFPPVNVAPAQTTPQAKPAQTPDILAPLNGTTDQRLQTAPAASAQQPAQQRQQAQQAQQQQAQPQAQIQAQNQGGGGGGLNIIGSILGQLGGSFLSKLFGPKPAPVAQPATQATPATASSNPAPIAPVSAVSIVANPMTVSAGKTSAISWSATGPTQCSLFDSNNTQIATGNPGGSLTTAPLSTTATFKVTCTGGVGSANGQVTVTVQ